MLTYMIELRLLHNEILTMAASFFFSQIIIILKHNAPTIRIANKTESNSITKPMELDV